MNLYLLECWTHATYPGPDGMGHDTCVVGIFNSEKKALEYAKSKPAYAGDDDDWDWVITRYELNEDPEYASMPKHFNRFGEQEGDPASYTPGIEDDEKEWIDEHNHAAQYQETDPGCNPFIDQMDGKREFCEKCGEDTFWECSCDDVDEKDPVVIKDGTISVSQPVNTQEDVDEFIGRLKKLKPNLPHREEKTVIQRIMELQAEILRILDEDIPKDS